jgi:protein-S-isoprenylcysteine O-methyltransferase Ste14
MRYADWIRRHRRTVSIPVVALALWLARFQPKYLWLSLLLVFSGEALRIWAAGHLQKDQILSTGGPYRMIRNPLYLGSFLIALGFCLIAGSMWIWILFAIYFIVCYVPVIQYEERILREKFPTDYERYADEVPALYPTFKLYREPNTHFSMAQVIRNKEYNAVAGIIAAYAFLIFLKS